MTLSHECCTTVVSFSWCQLARLTVCLQPSSIGGLKMIPLSESAMNRFCQGRWYVNGMIIVFVSLFDLLLTESSLLIWDLSFLVCPVMMKVYMFAMKSTIIWPELSCGPRSLDLAHICQGWTLQKCWPSFSVSVLLIVTHLVCELGYPNNPLSDVFSKSEGTGEARIQRGIKLKIFSHMDSCSLLQTLPWFLSRLLLSFLNEELLCLWLVF